MINYKFLIIGSRGVGKTSILNQYCHNLFINKYQPTFNYNYFSNNICVGNIDFKINLWDTSGISQDLHIYDNLIRHCNSIIIVYDITSISSFNNIDKWLVKIKKMKSYNGCDIILVGNKNDLDNREVHYFEGEKFAKDNNLLFIEVNSKNKDNINNLFGSIIKQLSDKKNDDLDLCYNRCC